MSHEADAGMRVQCNTLYSLTFFVFLRSFDFFAMIQRQQAAAVVPGATECCCTQQIVLAAILPTAVWSDWGGSW